MAGGARRFAGRFQTKAFIERPIITQSMGMNKYVIKNETTVV